MLAGAIDGERVRDRLQAMIAAALGDGRLTVMELLGLPPPDVVGELPAGFSDDADRSRRYAEHRRLMDERRAERQRSWLKGGE